MKNKIKISYVLIFLVGIILIGFASAVNTNPTAVGTYANPTSAVQFQEPSFSSYYTSEQISTYWPILKNLQNDQCSSVTSDFLVMIRPGSCTPAVVRSDLLEEQNVPVFCQLDSVKINPLIQVSSIKSISFKGGEYPPEIAGIAFHPARAAVRSYGTLLGSPVLNNIGYLVIILKQQESERNMTEWVSGNLTATIFYEAQHVFGTGQSVYYLPVTDDSSWSSKYAESAFWYGKGFLRALSVEDGKAEIGLYTDKENLFQKVTLTEGQTSDLFYFPGFYCKAGLKVKLNKITANAKQARLNVDGQEVWVREGDLVLSDKCRVSEINSLADSTGSVSLSCPQVRVSLMLSKYSASISVGDVMNDYGVGSLVSGNLYLGYVGEYPEAVSKSKESFIILVNSSAQIKDSDYMELSRAVNSVFSNSNSAKNYEKEIASKFGAFGRKVIFVNKSNEVTFGAVKIRFNGFSEKSKDRVYTDDKFGNAIETYFGRSVNSSMELLNYFPQEKSVTGIIAEDNLISQIEFAEKLGKYETAGVLIEEFLRLYPNSKSLFQIQEKKNNYNYFDYSKASANVFINNYNHNVKLDYIKPISDEEKNIDLNIDSASGRFSEGQKIGLGSDMSASENVSFALIKTINIDSVVIEYSNYDSVKKQYSSSVSYTLKESQAINLEGKNIILRKINVERVAYVSLIPTIDTTYSEANFSFKIGIEKRNIKLNPEKTEERIKNLNESIKKWEDINNKLGNVLKGWKGACFATSAVLMLKNLAAGFSGETMARQKVMETYRAKCASDPSLREMTKTECYNHLSSDINSDVSAMTNAIKQTNDNIKAVQDNFKNPSTGLLDGEVIDSEKARKAYQDKIREQYGSSVNVNVNGVNETIDLTKASLSFDELRSIETYNRLKASGVSASFLDQSQKELDTKLYTPYINSKAREKVDTFRGQINSKIGISVAEKGQNLIHIDGKSISPAELDGMLIDNGNTNLKPELLKNFKGGSAQVVAVGSDLYLVPLQNVQAGSSDYRAVGYYKVLPASNGQLDLIEKVNQLPAASSVKFVSSQGACKNQYQRPKAKYYENAPNNQLPAIVPFDVINGWYAKVPDTSGGLGSDSVKSYQASGEVRFFYICNVGSNGVEENQKGDDICQSVDVNTVGTVDSFLGCSMSSREVQDLYKRGREAVRQAAQQYETGTKSKKITIFGQSIEVDAPMQENLMECQDFMSPEDCKILFNVCDPVICPSSRCNLGGKYTVSNVVQSGIIGSLVLCLPNIKEGIMVPICLTGVHAGIESYISILKSHRDCLQENLKSGKFVGICDQIYSIYLCEFFWRQLAPVMNIIIPKLIESAYGQGTRGGGEYLTVTHSWDTMEKSISYFKDTYAQNAFRAFQVKNVEEAGTTFCRMFIGSSVPTSAKLLDNLLEPESPEQFYAWFTETPFTDATVPATSQYKVYFHIFAGNDKGVSYAVTLRDPPATSYYASAQRIAVKTAYIQAGESADESIDFTAPAGYKELCVMIDAQEHCGFRQVSTDFALNYLQKKYTEEQAEKRDITNEKECISGTPSVLSLVNPNIQGGVEESIQPEIALRGIVRVCSTNNPGVNVQTTTNNYYAADTSIESTTSEGSVNPQIVNSYSGANSRWVEVGYCGDQNIKCWLDSSSVKNDIQAVQAIEGSLSGLDSKTQTMYEDSVESEVTVNGKLDTIRKKINELTISNDILATTANSTPVDVIFNIDTKVGDIVVMINEVLEKGGLNSQKAEALSLGAGLYRKIVEILYPKLSEVKEVETAVAEKIVSGDLNPESTGNVSEEELKGDVLDEGLRGDVSKTCEEQEGDRCSENEKCDGKILDASDGADCCDVGCTAVTLESCSECGKGLFNIFCDRDECEGISEGCYFTDTGFSGFAGSCSICSEDLSCGIYNGNENSCESDRCTIGSCEWDVVGKVCKDKVVEVEGTPSEEVEKESKESPESSTEGVACSALGGDICSAEETCGGTLLGVSDLERCCDIKCTPATVENEEKTEEDHTSNNGNLANQAGGGSNLNDEGTITPAPPVSNTLTLKGEDYSDAVSLAFLTGDDKEVIVNGNVIGVVGESMVRGKITVNGNVLGGEHVGHYMQGGEVIIEGDVDGYVASGMRDGIITVNGEVYGAVGGDMVGGKIVVSKYVKGPIASRMKSGTIIVKSNVLNVVGHYMQGGEVIIEGDIRRDREIGNGMTGGKIISGGIQRCPVLVDKSMVFTKDFAYIAFTEKDPIFGQPYLSWSYSLDNKKWYEIISSNRYGFKALGGMNFAEGVEWLQDNGGEIDSSVLDANVQCKNLWEPVEP